MATVTESMLSELHFCPKHEQKVLYSGATCPACKYNEFRDQVMKLVSDDFFEKGIRSH